MCVCMCVCVCVCVFECTVCVCVCVCVCVWFFRANGSYREIFLFYISSERAAGERAVPWHTQVRAGGEPLGVAGGGSSLCDGAFGV